MLKSIALWIVAILVTILCLSYQDKTGPTYPLRGTIEDGGADLDFTFLRSENIGTDLKVMFADPLPDGFTAYVKYRRYQSHDDWTIAEMEQGDFKFRRRWEENTVKGYGAKLPYLEERAGKYEYFVYYQLHDSEAHSITGEEPIFARYKAAVPGWLLLIHVLAIFISMIFAIRTVLEAIFKGNYKWMIWATLISFILGGFVFGPMVQKYAFGVLWSGIPFGHDWTDNKVVMELLFWIYAAWMNRGDRRNRLSVILAGVATLIVYFIPHSIFGSEYNYITESGHGTIG